MEIKKLSEMIHEIEMPKDMQERIIRTCYDKMEEKGLGKNKRYIFWSRPMVAVATLVLCLCLTSITALATTGKLQGFFKDIVGWNGAVTGTSYEQATDKINLSVVKVSDKLTVMVEMVDPTAVPYITFDTFGIERYEIVNMNGEIVYEGKATEPVEIAGGKARIIVPLDDLAAGNYILKVREFVGSAKADQPLVLSGNWECEFSY